MRSDSACTSYESRWVELHFTDGKVCCKFCPLLETYSRLKCRLTDEYIVSDTTVGYWCPLLKADGQGQIISPFGEVIQT